MNILLVDEGSNQVSKIRDYIKRAGEEAFEIDTTTFIAAGGSISATYFDGKLAGEILFPNGQFLELNNVGALYTRGFNSRFIPAGVQDGEHEKWAIRNSQTNFNNVTSYLNCAKMNCSQASLAAINKGEQYKRCAELGIKTPKTLVSNCSTQVSDFISKKQDVVYKAMASTEGLDEHVIFTNLIKKADVDNAQSLRSVLSYFQEYVNKDIEIRAYVVGGDVLACEIHSQMSNTAKVDWRRFEISRTPHFSHSLPSDLERKLRDLVFSYGLAYGAIDLILDKSGQYIFLELNPDGIFDWVDELTTLPIAEKIADWLISARA